MQPAPCGTTHDKLTSNYPDTTGLRGFATQHAICLSPPSHGSKGSCRELLASTSPQSRSASTGVAGAIGGTIGCRLIELAVERRATDLQPPRDLGHLSAVMRGSKAEEHVLHLFHRPYFPGPGEPSTVPGGRHGRDTTSLPPNHAPR